MGQNSRFKRLRFAFLKIRVLCVLRFIAFRVLRLCISLRFGVLRFAAFRVFGVSGLMHLRLSQLFRSQGLSAFRLRFAFRRFSFRSVSRFGVLHFGVLRFVHFTGCVSKRRVSAAFRVSHMFASQRFAFRVSKRAILQREGCVSESAFRVSMRSKV